jgi:SPP1 gp7 family putative phage head morphogenesis protein
MALLDFLKRTPTVPEATKIPQNRKFQRVAQGTSGEMIARAFEDTEQKQGDITLQDLRIMKDQDGQIQMLLNAINNTILQSGVKIVDDPDYDSEEESEQKQFIEKNLLQPVYKGGMRKSMDLLNRYFLRAFEEGFRTFEIIYRNEGSQILLDYLAPRAGKDTNEFQLVVDNKGDFVGFQQRTSFKSEMFDVKVINDTDIKKVLNVVYGREYGSNYGRSGLMSARYHYDKAHKLMFLSHIASELGSVKFRRFITEGILPEEKRTALLDVMDKIGLESVMLYNKQDGELIFDDVSDANVMEATMQMVDRHYSLMSKSVLAQFVDLGSSSSQTGSRSLGDSQMKFFKQGVQSVATILIENAWNEIIPDLIRMNFKEMIVPKLIVNPIDDDVSELLYEAFRELISKGDISDSIKKEIQIKGSDKLHLDITAEMLEEDEAKKQEHDAKQQSMEMDKIKVQSELKNQIVEKKELSEDEPMARPLFPDEEKVRVDEIREKYIEIESRSKEILRKRLLEVKDKIVEQYILAMRQGRRSMSKVKIELSDKESEYEKALKQIALEMLEYGKVNGANEVDRGVSVSVGVPTTPKKKVNELMDEVSMILEEQANKIHFSMLRLANEALKRQMTEQEVRNELANAFEDYIKKAVPATVHSLVPDSFNLGQEISFDALRDKIFAFRYTAILDDRTTPLCLSLDGRVFAPNDPNYVLLTPKNHIGCRSKWTPITYEEEKKAREDGTPIVVNGKPPTMPITGSVNQWAGIADRDQLFAKKNWDTIKATGIIEDMPKVSMNGMVKEASVEKYNKIFETMSKNMQGESLLEGLQALRNVIPDDDTNSLPIINTLSVIYGIKKQSPEDIGLAEKVIINQNQKVIKQKAKIEKLLKNINAKI